jgi:mono/diheme cytochrome c family protein
MMMSQTEQQTGPTAADRPAGGLCGVTPTLVLGWTIYIATVAVVLVAGWVVMYWASVRLSPNPALDAELAAAARQQEEIERVAALGPPGPALDLTAVARGQRLFAVACVACHGADAKGKPNLGKDLVTRSWTRKMSDQELADLIIAGRAATDPLNTTHVPMPPRGGRVDFGDRDIGDIVTYVRSLQDARRVTGPLPKDVKVAVLDFVEEPTPVAAPAAVVAAAVTPAKADSTSAQPAGLDPAAITRGKRVYMSCLACHGRTGEGVPKTGADLVHSTFVKAKTDAELLAFIKKGRAPGEPDSKLNLAMPAKGGNPSLKDNQIQDVITYIRSLQQTATAAAK